jgi:hypothetical protein
MMIGSKVSYSKSYSSPFVSVVVVVFVFVVNDDDDDDNDDDDDDNGGGRLLNLFMTRLVPRERFSETVRCENLKC